MTTTVLAHLPHDQLKRLLIETFDRVYDHENKVMTNEWRKVDSRGSQVVSPAAIRAEIKAALRAGDMEMAWTWVSRIVGNRIVAGEIAVKLKRHRL